ncbi:MAG: polymerase, sigma-24 subunit, subfamily [Armatimonadetes bacterium]|nr:polymerase, sigma-24 subunit, subfamily [Armatimonadota bacterium]
MRHRPKIEFEDLYREHGDRVYRYCLRLCRGNVSEAQDIAQETFFRAYRTLGGFEKREAAAAWVLSIARTEWIRSYRRSQDVLSLEEVDEVPDPRGDPSGAHLDRVWLEATISRLPEHQREALILVKGEGLTHREAAEVLGIPQGTLQFHVHEAIRYLRRVVSEERRLPGAMAFFFVLLLQRQLQAAVPAPPELYVRLVEGGASVPRSAALPLGKGVGATAMLGATAVVLVPAWNEYQSPTPRDARAAALVRSLERLPAVHAAGTITSWHTPQRGKPFTQTTPLDIWFAPPGRYLGRIHDERSEHGFLLIPGKAIESSRGSKLITMEIDRERAIGGLACFSFFTREGLLRKALAARRGVQVSEQARPPGSAFRQLTIAQEEPQHSRRWVVEFDRSTSRLKRVVYDHSYRSRFELPTHSKAVLDRITYGAPFPSDIFASRQVRP